MKRWSIYYILIISFFVFLALSFLIKGFGHSDFISTVLGITSFIFGVVLAFSTENRHSRLSSIREKLREQDAVLMSIYQLSKVFGKKISDKVKNKIEELLITQIDYKLIDFDMCMGKIESLFSFVENLKVNKKGQVEPQKKMIDNMDELLKIEKEVAFQVKNSMMFYEWGSLLILGGIILFCLFSLKENTFFSTFITAVLSTCLVLLLLVLEQFDSLTWQEQSWIWIPLSIFFTEMGLVPYFPEDVFIRNRINFKQLRGIKKIRIAHYPNFYPDHSGKTIEVIKL